MSEFTDRLKAQAPLGEIVGEYVALRPAANGFIGLCPFHGEKTPSFHVHAERRFFHCFGCAAHGDVFDFLMRLKQVGFAEAVEMVAERLGIEVPRAAGETGPQRELLMLHQVAGEFFARALAGREGTGARAYLQNREFPPEVAERFHLGFAPAGGRTLSEHLARAGVSPELALRGGLCQLRRGNERAAAPERVDWDGLYDRFRDRLMFPIADERGRVIAFGGRALVAGERVPKYLNSPEHPLYVKGRVLYNLDRARVAIRELGYVILVEGYFDCIRVAAAGFENVVASCGTALTAAQVAHLARLTRKAVVNFDPDTAGAAAAERSVGLLLEESFQMRILVLDGGLDPDLYIRRHGAGAYGEALKASRSFFDYLVERARRQFDLSHAAGKVAALNHLLPYLSHVHDPIVRQEMAENCATQLGVDVAVLGRQLRQAVRERRRELPAEAQRAVAALLPAERMLLRAGLESEVERARVRAACEAEALFEGLPTEALITKVLSADAAAWEALHAGLGADEQRWVAEALLDAAPMGTELVETALASLRQRRVGRRVRQLQAEIQQAAAAGDRERLETLVRQKAALDSQRRAESGNPKSGN